MTDLLPRPVLALVETRFDDKCSHSNTTIEVNKRILKCAQCDAVLDPFDFLMEAASKLRRLSYSPEQIAMLTWKLRKLEDDILLKRAELQRLKGQCYREKKKSCA